MIMLQLSSAHFHLSLKQRVFYIPHKIFLLLWGGWLKTLNPSVAAPAPRPVLEPNLAPRVKKLAHPWARTQRVLIWFDHLVNLTVMILGTIWLQIWIIFWSWLHLWAAVATCWATDQYFQMSQEMLIFCFIHLAWQTRGWCCELLC